MKGQNLSGLIFLLVFGYAYAHSWIDNISQVDNLTNIGYIRGYAGHSDAASTFTIFSSASTQALCKDNEQSMSYTSQYPMLHIPAGKSLVANYSENGHVTKDSLAPDFKPHPGNYTWFLAANSVASPSPLSTIGQAYKIGTIIATGDFDDGVCAEDATKGRNGPRQCQSVVNFPGNLAAGTYELVWLWNFPKVAGVVEMYSSCMDIQISANADSDSSGSSASTGDTKVALADNNDDVTSSSTSSAQHTTKTSTIFQTTQFITTVFPIDTTPSPTLPTTNSLNTQLASRTTALSDDTADARPSTLLTTTSAAQYTTVQQVVKEAPANPLFDSNNVAYVTELVTLTIYKKVKPTS